MNRPHALHYDPTLYINKLFEVLRIIMENFDLIHSQNMLSIYNFSYSPEDEKSGNPYNTTFFVKIVSGEFSGIGECEYDIKEFKKFAKEINELYEFKIFEVLLKDICYGSTVKFKLDKIGHLEITGDIFGSGMIHSLQFSFQADQTSLKSFADSLKPIL